MRALEHLKNPGPQTICLSAIFKSNNRSVVGKSVATKGRTMLIAGYPRFKLAVSFGETAALPQNPADSSRAHDTSSINCFIVTFQSPDELSA
jgi:hypothetical protein